MTWLAYQFVSELPQSFRKIVVQRIIFEFLRDWPSAKAKARAIVFAFLDCRICGRAQLRGDADFDRRGDDLGEPAANAD